MEDAADWLGSEMVILEELVSQCSQEVGDYCQVGRSTVEDLLHHRRLATRSLFKSDLEGKDWPAVDALSGFELLDPERSSLLFFIGRAIIALTFYDTKG